MKIGVLLYSVPFNAATYQFKLASMEVGPPALVAHPSRVRTIGTVMLDSAARLPRLVTNAVKDQYGLESLMTIWRPSAAIKPALVMTRSYWLVQFGKVHRSMGLTITTGHGTSVTKTVVKVKKYSS